MDRKMLITFMSVTALVTANPGIAHDLHTFDEESPEVRAWTWQDEQRDRIEPEESRWIIEENRWDEYQDRQEVETARQQKPKQTDNFSNRFVNPRPDLGCLYFDENNVRHWYPNCREL